jgi:hypothetical protein
MRTQTVNKLILEEKRSWVIALAIGCPMGKRSPECPVKKLSGLPLPDLVKAVGGMGESELDGLTSGHCECLSRREGVLRGAR